MLHASEGTRNFTAEAKKDGLIKEASRLLPRFFRGQQLLPDRDLARMPDYHHFLRIGIELWLIAGPEGFRGAVEQIVSGETGNPRRLRAQIAHLWNGIEMGCMTCGTAPPASGKGGSESHRIL